MPVAQKHSTIFEESNLTTAATSVVGESIQLEDVPMPTRVDQSIFEEIIELINRKKRLEEEEKDNRSKIEKLEAVLVKFEADIKKGEETREHLAKRNQILKESCERRGQKIKEATKYWIEENGIDAKQLSNDQTDNFKLYEFTFSKLSKNPKRLSSTNQNQHQQIEEQTLRDFDYRNYKIQLKHYDRTLMIVSQTPDLLTGREIDEFNENLSRTCIPSTLVDIDNPLSTANVDFKLVVLKIKNALKTSPPTSVDLTNNN